MNSRKLYATVSRIKHRYVTFNNVVVAVAFLVAAGWLWGSLRVMDTNYMLQRQLDSRQRELMVARLQKENFELQKRYYETNEYKEMAAREFLGLVMPGERVLILPANTEAAKQADTAVKTTDRISVPEESNLEQWTNFLFGGYSRNIQLSQEDSSQSK